MKKDVKLNCYWNNHLDSHLSTIFIIAFQTLKIFVCINIGLEISARHIAAGQDGTSKHTRTLKKIKRRSWINKKVYLMYGVYIAWIYNVIKEDFFHSQGHLRP